MATIVCSKRGARTGTGGDEKQVFFHMALYGLRNVSEVVLGARFTNMQIFIYVSKKYLPVTKSPLNENHLSQCLRIAKLIQYASAFLCY